MGQERKAPEMGGFLRFDDIGTRICGRVTRYGSGANGVFVVIAPAVIRIGDRGENLVYASAAVGLKADLKAKITDSDRQKLFGITFRDREPTRMDNPKKIFHVEELSTSEMSEIWNAADKTNIAKPYVTPDSNGNGDDGEALPF